MTGPLEIEFGALGRSYDKVVATMAADYATKVAYRTYGPATDVNVEALTAYVEVVRERTADLLTSQYRRKLSVGF